jgi:hypothetical protein
MGIEAIIGIVSAIIAFVSAIFAWKAVKTAEKTYSTEVITQIYNIYHSETLRQDLQTVWSLYHQVWRDACEDEEEATKSANGGIPISEKAARELVQEMRRTSPEYRALDNVIGFWTYVALLISQRVLDVQRISAFATPRILGFLYPIDEAKAALYGYKIGPRLSLKHLYGLWQDKHLESF